MSAFSRRIGSRNRRKLGAGDSDHRNKHVPAHSAASGFHNGIQTALAPGGVFVIEAHYLVDLLEQGAFDTIYHEHVSYWALGPMSVLFEQAGMEIVHVERLPLHHGQIRVFVQRKGESPVTPACADLLEMERSLGITSFQRISALPKRRKKSKRTCMPNSGVTGKENP